MEQEVGRDSDPRRWLVTLPGGIAATDEELLALADDLPDGVRLLHHGHVSRGGSPVLLLLATDEQLRDLLESGRFPGDTSIETDIWFQLDEGEDGTPADPASGERRLEVPWHLDRIDDRVGLDGSYSPLEGQDGSGAHVYVLDTGIRITHDEFGGRAVPAINIADYNSVHVCTDPTDVWCADDVRGHGTHVAATVAGATYGVAKGATVHGVKCLDDKGWGIPSYILMAFDWVTTNAQRPAIIQASFGLIGVYSSIMAVVKAAIDNDITVVVAAGNQNSNACSYTPPNVPETISVACVDRYDEKASFSNFGVCVDLFAPGSDIVSASPASDSATTTKSGTSMSTPIVSGAMALIRGADPSLTEQESKDLLLETATVQLIPNPFGSPNLILYTGLKSDSYTTLTDTSTTTTVSTGTDTPAFEWRSLAPGYCRDVGCVDRVTCQNRYSFAGQCMTLQQCEQTCASNDGCIAFAWAQSPEDSSNSCRESGSSRCVTYTDVNNLGAPAATTLTKQEYTCYFRQHYCGGRVGVVDGTFVGNHYPCTCGSAICTTNEMCHESSGTCTPAPCSATNGQDLSDAYPCTCGASVCSDNEVCDQASGTCQLRECSVTDGQLASAAYPCACGSTVCEWNHACDILSDACYRMLVVEGQCDYPITTLEECSSAAASLGLSDTTAVDDGQSGVAFDPPYCYIEAGVLKVNLDGSNTGDCNGGDQCLCASGVTTTRTTVSRTTVSRTTVTTQSWTTFTSTATTVTATTVTTTATTGTRTTGTTTVTTSTRTTGTETSTVTTVAVQYRQVGDGRCLTESGASPWMESTQCVSRDGCEVDCAEKLDCAGFAWSASSSQCGSSGHCILYLQGNEAEISSTTASDQEYGCYVQLFQFEAYRIVEEGICDWPWGPIMSVKECAVAARAMLLDDDTVSFQDDAVVDTSHLPPFCYYQLASLIYDKGGLGGLQTNSGDCTAAASCICGAPTTTVTSTLSTTSPTSTTTATTTSFTSTYSITSTTSVSTGTTSGTSTTTATSSTSLTSTTGTSSITLTSTTESSTSSLTTSTETSTFSATSTTRSSTSSLTSTTESSTSETSTNTRTTQTVTNTLSTGSTTTTVTTMTGFAGPIVIHMTVQGVNYTMLAQSDSLRAGFEAGVAEAVAADSVSAGHDVFADNVSVALSEGQGMPPASNTADNSGGRQLKGVGDRGGSHSGLAPMRKPTWRRARRLSSPALLAVFAQAAIAVPPDVSASTLRSNLEASPSFGDRVADAVREVPGMDAAIVGEVYVTGISVSATSTYPKPMQSNEEVASADVLFVLIGGGSVAVGITVVAGVWWLFIRRGKCLRGGRSRPLVNLPVSNAPPSAGNNGGIGNSDNKRSVIVSLGENVPAVPTPATDAVWPARAPGVETSPRTNRNQGMCGVMSPGMSTIDLDVDKASPTAASRRCSSSRDPAPDIPSNLALVYPDSPKDCEGNSKTASTETGEGTHEDLVAPAPAEDARQAVVAAQRDGCAPRRDGLVDQAAPRELDGAPTRQESKEGSSPSRKSRNKIRSSNEMRAPSSPGGATAQGRTVSSSNDIARGDHSPIQCETARTAGLDDEPPVQINKRANVRAV